GAILVSKCPRGWPFLIDPHHQGVILVSKCPRGWPFLIDPHHQALEWILQQSSGSGKAGGFRDVVKQDVAACDFADL
ncbi:hypothetical protein T484DRAFT_1846349, partial [Baffinella frigidus]